jgi:hypothetical protein
VVVHFEPRGHKTSKIGRAPVKIEDTATGLAAKVMVMILPRKLIPLRFAGNFDGDQPPFFHEALHGAINRSNSEIWGVFPAILKDLLRAQGASNLAKNPANSTALRSIPLQGTASPCDAKRKCVIIKLRSQQNRLQVTVSESQMDHQRQAQSLYASSL